MDMRDSIKLKMCSIIMHYSPKKLDVAVQLLSSVVGRIEVKPGCHSCWAGRCVAEDNCVNYQELWNSEEKFSRHIQSEEFQRVLAAMDLCDEEPRVMIGSLKANYGIDWLRKLRASATHVT
jgi:quinol monooxygenase YgiN